MKRIVLFFICAAMALAQTTINGGRVIIGSLDASGAATTKPVKSGTSLPGTCAVGEFYNKTDDVAGVTLYACTATNTWTRAAYSQGASAPGTCTLGQVFFDTDASAGQNLFGCTATDTWTQLGSGADGVGYDEVLDEAGGLTKRAKLNFTGAGVSCADNSGATRTDCTIPALEATTMRQVYDLSMPTCNSTASVVGYGVWSLATAEGAAVACSGGVTAFGPNFVFADAAAGKRIHTQVILPANWSSADAVSAVIFYGSNYKATCQVKFFVETACVAGGENRTFSYNTAASQVGTAGNDVLLYSMTVASIPMTNCAANEALRLQVHRADSEDADDTLDAVDARIFAIQLRYKVTVD